MPLIFFPAAFRVVPVRRRRINKQRFLDCFEVVRSFCILCGSRRRRRGVGVVSDDRACTCPVLRARAYTAYTARRGIGLVAVPVLRAGFRASGPNALEYVGVLAVEIFVVQGNGGPKVLVNEIRCGCTIPDTGRSTARRSRSSSNTSAPSPASR
jgi:hypothetical protein